MTRANVTLSQILGAATSRAAVMVPESAGFLVLSLCEATGCLPTRIDESHVLLLPEGAVMQAQQGEVLGGSEAARGIRELLAKLLALTVGSAPRLAAVARPRAAAMERGVDQVAAEIEAALVPLNRAAAKRTLARLARETARAVDAGLLVAPRPVVQAPQVPPRFERQVPAMFRTPLPAAVAAAAPATATAAATATAPAAAAAAATATAAATAAATATAAAAAPAPAPASALAPVLALVPSSVNPVFAQPTPTAIEPHIEVLATPTQLDPLSLDVRTATSAPMDVVDKTPVGEPSVSRRPPASTHDSEHTLVSARDIRVESTLEDKHPHVAITDSSGHEPQPPREHTLVSACVAAVPAEELSADSLIPSGAPSAPSAPISSRNRGKIEVTLPWPVGLGMPVRTPFPTATHTIAVEHAVTPEPPSEPISSAEALQSFEYEVWSPVRSPAVAALPEPLSPSGGFSELLAEAADPSPAPPLSAENHSPIQYLSPIEYLTPVEHHSPLEASTEDHSPFEHVVSAAPPDEIAPLLLQKPAGRDRVNELLAQFALPEGGEDALLRQTASSLKELAGLSPTPYAPPIEPMIRIAPRPTDAKSPAWLPETPRHDSTQKPAPLVRGSKRSRARVLVPLALLVFVIVGTSVVAWKRPDLFSRLPKPWQPATAKTEGAAPLQEVVSADEGE